MSRLFVDEERKVNIQEEKQPKRVDVHSGCRNNLDLIWSIDYTYTYKHIFFQLWNLFCVSKYRYYSVHRNINGDVTLLLQQQSEISMCDV